MARQGDEGVVYRALHPGDYAALKLLHQRLFPLDYDDEFFHKAVRGLDGIIAWAARAPLPPLPQLVLGPGLAPQLQAPLPSRQHADVDPDASEMLVGFITARSFPALYADPRDRQLLGVAGPAQDREKLLYVLTLGVAEAFQRRGIARRLLDSMMRSAAEAGCRAVYLHVARFNDAARAFYRAAGFSELAVLPSFYTIRTARQPLPGCDRYDACVLGLVITPSPPTPWHAVNLAVQPLTAVISSLNSCLLWGSERQGQQLNGAEAAGGAGEAGPAAAPAHCHIVEIEGATSWPGARPEDTRQPQNQQQASRFCLPGDPEYLSRHWSPVQPQPRPQPASGPPAWLRHMFIRH